tara:strand:+ start:222 stop:602 length:381 start_codon:yes stop_codon:yes gene_type:complete
MVTPITTKIANRKKGNFPVNQEVALNADGSGGPVSILKKTGAWTRKEGQSKTGGLNQKGVDDYKKKNPGSKLQTAVTTKPSKLKPNSKAALRRKSFCARMSGVKGPMKKPNGDPTRKALALRKWNC